MKKIELVYVEILYQCIEKQNRKLTQIGLSNKLGISLSTVNHALQPLKKMGAIEIKKRGFTATNPKKIVYHLASCRNPAKDIVYSTRVDEPVRMIESKMPAKTMFTSYSAYKYRYNDTPADYSEIYVYADKKEIEKRFPPTGRVPNLFVLKKEKTMDSYGEIAPAGLIFADLWNTNEWYAKEFLKALEVKLSGILE